MKHKKTHGLWSRVSRLVALTLALVLIVGVMPASAASNEIVVKTKKQLIKAMKSKSAATIIFRTNRKTKFIIPEIANSTNKKFVMEAPNARAFNKATFKTITLNESEYFNERGNDNSLYIKGDGVKLTVSKGIEAKKVSITATDVIIKVAGSGNVGDIVCNKKEADITIAVAKNAEANITIKKKADLTVTGDKSADITVVAKAAESKITATAPVEIVAEKKIDVVLEKGSEGSKVESSKDVAVEISGEAKKQATITEDGKTVQEPEKTEEKKEDKKEDKKEEEKKEEEKKDTTPATTEPSATPSTPSGGGSTVVDPVKAKYKVTLAVENDTLGTAVATCGSVVFKAGETVELEKGSIVRIGVTTIGKAVYAVVNNLNDPDSVHDYENESTVEINDNAEIVVRFAEAARRYVAVISGGSISLSPTDEVVVSGASIVYKEEGEIKLINDLNESGNGADKGTHWTNTSERNQVKVVDFTMAVNSNATAKMLENCIVGYCQNLFPHADMIIIPKGITVPVMEGVTFIEKILKK